MIIKQSSSLKPEETKGKLWKNRVVAFPLTLWVDLVIVTKHLWAPVRILFSQPILAWNWEPCSEMCPVLQAWLAWRLLQLLAARRSFASLSVSFPSFWGKACWKDGMLSYLWFPAPSCLLSFSHTQPEQRSNRAGQYFSILKAFDYSWLISFALKRN